MEQVAAKKFFMKNEEKVSQHLTQFILDQFQSILLDNNNKDLHYWVDEG